MSNQIYHLPVNYQLQEYQIQSVLGAGGFGVTYLAVDTHLDAKVAIKEFFPSELAVRESGFTVHTKFPKYREDFQWGLQRFIQEAKILAQLRHPNIVRVTRFLEANHTAYLVMEYEEGDSLLELIRAGEKATEEEVMAILLPLLSGLQQMHEKGILHRDIKPANVYIRSDNSPVLLDFGSARYDVESRSRSVTAIVTPGYAPFEQYETKAAAQGAWTDIYALGAVAYRLISGVTPPEAPERIGAVMRHNPDPLEPAVQVGKRQYSDNLLRAIDWALKVTERERPQSVAEWENALVGRSVKRDGILKNRPATSNVVTDPPVYTKPVQKTRTVSFLSWFALVLSLMILAGYWGMKIQQKDDTQPTVQNENIEVTAQVVEKSVPEVVKPKSEKKLVVGDIFQHTLKDGSLGPKMVLIPKGSFRMGDIQGDGNDDWEVEKPVHKVTFDYEFGMGKYEVTLGEFKRFVQTTGYGGSLEKHEYRDEGCEDFMQPRFSQTDTHPVTCIEWEDAKTYVQWLSDQTNFKYRLPSEAEWEYAARAGTKTKYWWGDETSNEYMNCSYEKPYTLPVGSFPVNPFGLHDMNGNVMEWIEDDWHDNYENAPTDGSAWKVPSGFEGMMTRGGGYGFADCENFRRFGFIQDSWLNNVGFRLVISIPEEWFIIEVPK